VKRGHRAFKLTPELVSAHSGGPVICLDESAIGRTFRLSPWRPEAIEPLTPAGLRAAGVEIINAPEDPELEAEFEEKVAFVRVDIKGPLEQRAHYNDSGCGGGWTDGYDAIAERMIAALEQGNVLMVIDSPGGAVAGLQEAIKRIQAEKAELNRIVVAYADELIASAAYWLAATLADEIYVPEMGSVGSIGARSAHQSIAGALEEAGVDVTHFGWPGEGKYAFAAELPLSDIAKKRAQRDVAIAGEAFAAAVVAGRPGLTRDAIVELDADCLTGSAAVDAGLVDDVASLDEVIEMLVTISQHEETDHAEAS